MGEERVERPGAAGRLTGLLRAAQALAAATTEGDVLAAVAIEGARALGARATAVSLLDPGRRALRTMVATARGAEVTIDVTDLPEDHPLPLVRAARTGESWFLPDRASAVAALPEARELYETSRTQASAVLPLRAGERSLGALGLAFDDERPWPRADLELVEALAALMAQALDRLAALAAERAAVHEVRRVLDALRTSLAPSASLRPMTGLDVVSASRPAAQELGLGGDWTDTVVVDGAADPDDGAAGPVLLTVGDVVGHDGVAAVAVAHVRGALRGALRTARGASPAVLLTALDEVLSAPDLGVLATAVVCVLHRGPPATGSGEPPVQWWLRWSSAGHVPPLLRHPDGGVEALESGADLLLGLADERNADSSPRREQLLRVTPGSALLLVSDGVLERRGESFEQRQDRLVALLSQTGGGTAAALVEAVVSELGPGAEDDLTVLAAVLS